MIWAVSYTHLDVYKRQGVVFSLDGKIQKIGQNVILCSPAQIGVQGQINLGNPDDFDEE